MLLFVERVRFFNFKHSLLRVSITLFVYLVFEFKENKAKLKNELTLRSPQSYDLKPFWAFYLSSHVS